MGYWGGGRQKIYVQTNKGLLMFGTPHFNAKTLETTFLKLDILGLSRREILVLMFISHVTYVFVCLHVTCNMWTCVFVCLRL